MKPLITLLCLFLVQAALVKSLHAEEIRDFSGRLDLEAIKIQSGTEFLTAESQALQADDFANPGLLWVDRGRKLFNTEGAKPSCQGCHETSKAPKLKSVATEYPKFASSKARLINLEQRVNLCRVEQQELPELAYESEDLLALTAYLTNQAKGQPYAVQIDGPAAAAFTAGRDYFFTRKGQLNLACNQCHDDNYGKMLRGDRMSQGHPNAFPAYRIEWQTLGSLHRRLQDCDQGIRAQVQPQGSDIYNAVELYLKWRAANLQIESPGIRR